MICIWRIAERYTLIVVWEMLAAARWVTNSIKVDSDDGIGEILVVVQKSMYFLFPAEYVATVDGASPWARKRSALLWRSAKFGVFGEGTG